MRTAIIACALFSTTATAAELPSLGGVKKDDWYTAAVKKVEATFEPAEAKPGQTVTLKLAVYLNPGYHTYPLRQIDKAATGYVNKIAFPDPAAVVFVGDPIDPLDFKTKAELEAGITEMRVQYGVVVYERRAIVSPKTSAGPVAVKLPSFKLSICNQDKCYPTKSLTPEASLKVLDGPAVEIEKTFAEEVKKALAGK